jgi:two-component system, LytTR family, sensor kinase
LPARLKCSAKDIDDGTKQLNAKPQARPARWARLRSSLQRDELGFPAFWPLQIIGWAGFYVVTMASILPYLQKPSVVWANSALIISMFIVSCLLRPVCRSLLARGLPWISLELRGFGWSLLAGAIAAIVWPFTAHSHWGPSWAEWLEQAGNAGITLFLWVSLYFSVKQWQQSAAEKNRLLRVETEARDARLSALRYQLNPHFLFNSLNAVSTLVLDGNASAATRMLAQIGELLRTILDNEAVTETTLSQEIAFTEQYLAIEQTRLGGRLRLEVSIEADTLNALVPSMLLQPLVENAVRHGVAPLVEGGSIRIRSHLKDSRLQITVKNSGAPRRSQTGTGPHTNGIGLNNTMERLKTFYGADHEFVLHWPEAGGCEVAVELPYRQSRPTQVG